MNASRIRKGLVAALLAILLLPLLQSTIGWWPQSPLKGLTSERSALPKPSLPHWLDGSLQDSLQHHLWLNAAFRNSLIRLNNQYYYSAYHLANSNHVEIGKDGYLFDPVQIDRYLGSDFLGWRANWEFALGMDALRKLLQKKGIAVGLVIVPSKARACSDHFGPGRSTVGGITNYDVLPRMLDSLKVPTLDLVAWLATQEKTYPIYAPSALHMTEYGATLAADTLLAFASELLSSKLPRFKVRNVVMSDTARGADADILEGMNLLFPPSIPPLAYPEVEWDSTLPTKRLLTIGDSHYFFPFQQFSGRSFTSSQYWFYYRELHTLGRDSIQKPSQVDLRLQAEQQDLILFYISDGKLSELSWGYLQTLLSTYYDPKWRNSTIARLEADIRKDPNWMAQITAKAIQAQVPVDTMLRRDAIWVMENSRLQ